MVGAAHRLFVGIPVLQPITQTNQKAESHSQKLRKFENFHFQTQEACNRGISNDRDVAELYVPESTFLVLHRHLPPPWHFFMFST